MHRGNRTRIAFTLLLLFGCLLLLGGSVAGAKGSESVGVREAHAAAVKAQQAYRDARYVERTTRAFTARYGRNVGRWVWLALDCGWPRSTIPQLMYIIDRESGGSPKAKNPTSSATGLLQMLAFWWDGSGDWGWRFSPTVPRNVLHYGYLIWRKVRFEPWAL